MINRTRALMVSGVLAGAVALPILPGVGVATASAAPAATTATASATASAQAAASTSKRGSKSSRAAATRRSALSKGYSLRGVPYRYGGSTPRGFDCSGFTQYIYKQAGKSIPRTASAQRGATTRISKSAAVPGDLVFFHRNGRVYHVGVYAGGNKVLHAPRTGTRVRTESIWTSNVSYGRVRA